MRHHGPSRNVRHCGIQSGEERQAERHETVESVESVAVAAEVENKEELDIPGDLKSELRRLLANVLVTDYLAEHMGDSFEDGDGTQGDAIPPVADENEE